MASASCSPCGALASPEPGRKILPRMISHSELRKLFYSADAVCFDVDSTVISEEGIEGRDHILLSRSLDIVQLNGSPAVVHVLMQESAVRDRRKPGGEDRRRMLSLDLEEM
ncbi:putative phosphoserine phosphatase-like protein [Pan paniscus]|uniref:putative phosphoserine phosphatase-like protein n=1 Tax=Pan paniscus TaxID=9597 RepID=UPI0030076F3E